MRIFHLILIGIPLLSLTYWIWAHWRLKRMRAPGSWHLALGLGMGLLVIGSGWVILSRSDGVALPAPSWLYALVLLWALAILPLMAVPLMAGWSILAAVKALVRTVFGEEEPAAATAAATASHSMTRRQMLGTTAIALPMLTTFGTTAVGLGQRNRFRIREITVRLRELPKALDGVRIAHISDTHVGKFTRGKLLHELADATNRLEADLVLLTGDLIDHSIGDLPEALDMIQRMNPRSGLFTIEGNHDLFDGVEPFVQGVRERGIALLRDESSIVQVRGRPVQIMGLSWHGRGGDLAAHVDAVADQRDPDAFPILLAHHPHAFDRAAERGIPLTLAGHTHGGQLMLTPDIGPGPMMFKYWSGLYQDDQRAIVVSNGAGNWFPLRTAAPAEIVQVTLRRG